MINYEDFRPNPTLEMDIRERAFNEHVAEVNEHLSRIGAKRFIDAANEAEIYRGMQYGVIGGGLDRSTEAAILMPGTFANGVWPHILARGEAICFAAANAGLRDGLGNIVPVIVTGSPGMLSNFDLNGAELDLVRKGDYAPLAARHKNLAVRLGVEVIRGIVASSQAAAIAARLASEIELSDSVDGSDYQVVMAEPPHAKRREVLPVARQLVNFAREGASFKKQVADEGIDVIDEIFASGQASPDFEKGIIKERRENLAIIRGFARGELANDLANLTLRKIPTTLVHGSDSKVSRSHHVREDFEKAAAMVRGANRGTADNWLRNLRRLEVSGTNHSLMDRVGRFAVIAAANLTG